MRLAVFVSCDEAKQVTELKKFLRNHGAKSLDTSEIKQENWIDGLVKCLEHLSLCWKDDSVSESDISDILSTVASLIALLPLDRTEEVVSILCEKLMDFSGENSRKHRSKLLALNFLFSGFEANNHCRFIIYLTLVSCAEKLGMVNQIITDPIKVSSWLTECGCTVEECRRVWRKLHETNVSLGENRRAVEALVYLLSTYDDSAAADAKEDATKCIISVIQDPSLLSHDQLYALKPIQHLQNEPVHDFFQIFVSGTLTDFKAFMKKHPNFLKENNLDEKACMHKLRLLTLMQLSENLTELSYEAACNELKIAPEDLEAFIIEAVRQRALACKLDQVQQKILITGAFPRAFGPQQWINLRETLLQWRSGLTNVHSSLCQMVQNEA